MMEDFRLVIITGLSGAGKTQASRHMEDLGYFCIDNLPPVFIPKVAELCAHSTGRVEKVALVVDTRSGEFFDTLLLTLDELDKKQIRYEILFMEASDAAIIRRYKETRRSHPMAPSARISEGIARERAKLKAVRGRATCIIDTSELPKAALKEKIIHYFGEGTQGQPMSITVLSFGFKFGMPLDADIMFDVRFLPNPFYLEELRHKSGMTPEVAAYIEKWPVTQQFMQKLEDLVAFLVPQYKKEGKSQLVIAIGCTGGMHRSVYVTGRIFELLKGRGYTVNMEHRDMTRHESGAGALR